MDGGEGDNGKSPQGCGRVRREGAVGGKEGEGRPRQGEKTLEVAASCGQTLRDS